MSPPATRVHEPAGSKAAASPGSFAVRPHSSTVLTAPTPNSRRSPQSRVRTDRPTASARRKASRLRFAARSLASVAASGARTSRVASAGRSPRRRPGSRQLRIRRAPARRTSCSSPRGRRSPRRGPFGRAGFGSGLPARWGRRRWTRGSASAAHWAPPAMGRRPMARPSAMASDLGPGAIGPDGVGDGVSDPTSPPPTVRTMATARTARTVTRGSRFTAAIVTAAHPRAPRGEAATAVVARPGATAVRAKPRLRSSRMGDAGKAPGSTGASALKRA